MCNCIKDIETKAFEKLKNDKSKFGVVNSAEFITVGFDLMNGGVRLYNDITYEMTNKKKDGSVGSTRNYSISVYHTYCPFCGEKQIKDELEKTEP